MNSIPQKSENVKRGSADYTAVSGYQMHKQLAAEVAEKLIIAGLPKRGKRMKECSNFLQIERCADCGKVMVRGAKLCRDRLCPTCNWRLSLKRYASMSRVMQAVFTAHPEYTYSLVTLTAKNCNASELSMYMSEMQTAYNRCISQRWAREELTGWARSIEVTFNPDTKQLHPHYHIILACPLPQTGNRLVAEWLRQCTKRGLIVSSKAQDYSPIEGDHEAGESLAETICEVYKYAIKSKDISQMDAGTLYHLARQISGKRLISSGGIIKEYMQMLEIENMDSVSENEEDEAIEVCTHCGSVELDKLVAVWSMTGGRYHIKSYDEEQRVQEIAKMLDNNVEITQKAVKKAVSDKNFSVHRLQKEIAKELAKVEKKND